LEDPLGHVQLFPPADGRRHGQRPEDEQADGADRRLVDPAPRRPISTSNWSPSTRRTTFGRRGHAGELSPAAFLLDLQQRRPVLGAQLLRGEALADEPAIEIADEAGEVEPARRERADEVVGGSGGRWGCLDDRDRFGRAPR
jgi:hypothetical protein